MAMLANWTRAAESSGSMRSDLKRDHGP